MRNERTQVRLRAGQQRIEAFIARREPGPSGLGLLDFRSTGSEGAAVIGRGCGAPGHALVFASTRDASFKCGGFAMGETYQERCSLSAKGLRYRVERDLAEALHAVEAFIGEPDRAFPHLRTQCCAMTFPLDSAHFENVGKISGEKKRERDLKRLPGIVAELQPMNQSRIGQDPAPLHLDLVARQFGRAAMRIEIRVGQIDLELHLVIALIRIQEIRGAPVNPELEMTQIASVAMEKAKRFQWVVQEVAADVEDGKALSVGKHVRGAP